MILSGSKIKELLFRKESELKKRLIIFPILDIGDQIKDSNASVDLRLGQKFVVPSRSRVSHLDHLDAEHEISIEKYKEETFVPIGDYFVLHPRQFVLGETLEWIHLPYNLSAYVVGRSSWGRDGLIIATATGVHPYYSGILTLELSNVGEIPLYLYPGLSIVQLFIQEVDIDANILPCRGSFNGSTGPESVNAASKDRYIIQHFQLKNKIKK